jgi:SAM-dependent methyltransferase
VALKWLAGRDVRCVIDVGCGSGEFLAAALAEHPGASAIGVDLSSEAVRTSEVRFQGTIWEGRVKGVKADGIAVADWAGLIPDGGAGAVVSVWFVLHEFANSDVRPVVRFIRDIRAFAPHAELIIGEIVALPPEALASVRAESVYPELLLFHALSGQGVLTWKQHREWLDLIPYRVTEEERYDEVPAADGPMPSSVVWQLTPT